MRRILSVAALLCLATACPKIERTIYRFDLAAGTGEVRFVNITTDEPGQADGDFLQVVGKALTGTHLEEKHPGWRITSKAFTEEGDQLGALVTFTFDDPAAAGIYKHDKKSPWLWCAAPGSETLIATNGKRIDAVVPGCVVWERKVTTLEVTVREHEMTGAEVSLLPQYRRWKAGEPLERAPDPFPAVDLIPPAE